MPAVVFLCSIPIAYYGSPEAARWSWASLIVLGTLVPRAVQRAGSASNA
jgi:hypothetical protein